MTLDDQLTEATELKALILQGLKDNMSAGSLLGYTTNGTKVTYEGATKSYNLKKELDTEIAHLNILIANNKRLAVC